MFSLTSRASFSPSVYWSTFSHSFSSYSWFTVIGRTHCRLTTAFHWEALWDTSLLQMLLLWHLQHVVFLLTWVWLSKKQPSPWLCTLSDITHHYLWGASHSPCKCLFYKWTFIITQMKVRNAFIFQELKINNVDKSCGVWSNNKSKNITVLFK